MRRAVPLRYGRADLIDDQGDALLRLEHALLEFDPGFGAPVWSRRCGW